MNQIVALLFLLASSTVIASQDGENYVQSGGIVNITKDNFDGLKEENHLLVMFYIAE